MLPIMAFFPFANLKEELLRFLKQIIIKISPRAMIATKALKPLKVNGLI